MYMKKYVGILLCSAVFFLILLFGKNTVYAAQAIDSNYTGYYVGQLTAFYDPLGFEGIRLQIDHKKYYVMDDSSDSVYKTQDEIWFNSNDKTVVCEFVNGKIKRMDAFSDLFHINIISNFTPDSFIFQNGKYHKKEITMRIKVECVANGNTGYDADKLKNAKGNFPSVEKINLSIKSDKVFFKDSKSSTLSDTIKLKHGSDTINSYKLKIDSEYIPNNLNTQIEISKKASWDSGAEVSYVSSYVGIANIDMQQEKEETKGSTQWKKTVKKAQSSLNGSTAVTVDSNLNYYFDSAQRDEINKYLTVWLSEIIDAQTFEQSNASLTESTQKKVQQKILKKLGVSIDSNLFMSTTEASTMIEGESAAFGKVKVKFTAKVMGFSMDSNSSAFASLGHVEYEIVKCKKKSTYPTSGDAVVTSTKLNTFAEQVRGIADSAIEGVYNDFWGTDVNKVANLFVDTPFSKLLDGEFSGNFYKLLKKPTTNYLKKVSVKCPVDVYIYDWDGNICAEIVNNIINTDLKNVYTYIENDNKYIYLTRNDYVIKLVGNDSGKMEYSVELYEDDEIARTITTKDISLSVGKTYYTILPDCELDSDAYSLTSDANSTLEISSDSGRWSGEIADDFAGGEGSENNPYQIANAAQLAKLSQDVKDGNTYEGKYFVLVNDIDLNNTPWMPIGYWNSEDDYCYFKGMFDGNDFNICRLYRGYRSYGNFYGLFGDIEGAVIKNLNIIGSDISGLSPRYSGAVVGYMEKDSEIRNCIFNGTMEKGARDGYVGGLVGYMESSKIIDCKNYAVLNAGEERVIMGGIVAGLSKDSVVERCENRGIICSDFRNSSEAGRIGGIAGFGSGKIIDCVNYGQIYSVNDYYSGGIVGDGLFIVENCINKAELNGERIGGIAGAIGTGFVINCANEGNISGHDAAGICVSVSGGLIRNCANKGNISGPLVAGICVYIWHSSEDYYSGGCICDCYNMGELIGESVGGIVTSAEVSEIKNCYNRGNISGNEEYDLSCAGGILGEACASEISNVYSTGVISNDITDTDIGAIIGFSGTKDGRYYKENVFHNVFNSETDSEAEMGIVERDKKENIGLMDNDLIYILNEWVDRQEEDYCYWFVDDSGMVNDGYPYLKMIENKGVDLNEKNIVLNRGEKKQLSFITDTGASYSKLFWKSSNNNVATVSDEGLVSAIGNGKAIIMCTTDTFYVAICHVTVNIYGNDEVEIESLDYSEISLSKNNYTYDGKAKTPSVIVKMSGKTLILNTDYIVSYSNNTNVGTAVVTITGIGSYTGTVIKNFTIIPNGEDIGGDVSKISIAGAVITLSQNYYAYDGWQKRPSVTVKLNEKTLKVNEDYLLIYHDNIDVGTARIIIIGKGKYTGHKSIDYTIAESEKQPNFPDISCKKKIYKAAYGAKPFTINATSKSKLLFTSCKPGIVSVDKNTGQVTVKGTGIAGITIKARRKAISVVVKVSPKKASLKSVNAPKGRRLIVKWEKDKMATGYQIQVSTAKNFKKNLKKKNVSGNSYTFTKLKAGKKYYVRIRSYKKCGMETLYGTWSRVKQSNKIKN